MESKYTLLKDISHPFGNYKAGDSRTLHEWLDEFGVDWLSSFEECIVNNPEWFSERRSG